MALTAADLGLIQKEKLNAKPTKGHHQPASVLDLRRGARLVAAGWFTSNESWEVSEEELQPARYTIHNDQMRALNFNGNRAISISPEDLY